MNIKNITYKFIVKKFTIEQIVKVCCYISIPLVALIIATLVISMCVSGDINSNINNVTTFSVMFLNFSLPMLLLLGVLPTLILILSEKCTVKQLGFVITKNSTYIILF